MKENLILPLKAQPLYKFKKKNFKNHKSRSLHFHDLQPSTYKTINKTLHGLQSFK